MTLIKHIKNNPTMLMIALAPFIACVIGSSLGWIIITAAALTGLAKLVVLSVFALLCGFGLLVCHWIFEGDKDD